MRSPYRVAESVAGARNDTDGARLWLLGGLVAAIGFLFAVNRVPREIALVLVVGMGLTAGAVVASRHVRASTSLGGLRVESAAAAIAGMGAALGTALTIPHASGSHRLLLVVASAILVGLTALSPNHWRIGFLTPALTLIIAAFGLTMGYLRTHPTTIDVEVVLREGVAGLLQGRNPYELTFTNPYTPEQSELFFAPGILVDNRISIGFPYPPVVLLLAVPGYLLGDVRISGLIGLTLIAVAAHGRGETAERRTAALAFAFAPGSLFLTSHAWTESLSLALLMAAIVSARSRHFFLATFMLAAFFASKQYLIVALPCLWLLRGYATTARLLILGTSAAVLLLPWALINPYAYWRALSGGHMGDLIRFDSISLLVQSVATFGWENAMLFRWLPLAVGLSIAVGIAVIGEPSYRAFLVGTALSVMAAVLFSKQSFFNYYYLVGIVLSMAAFVGPRGLEEASWRNSPEELPRELASADPLP